VEEDGCFNKAHYKEEFPPLLKEFLESGVQIQMCVRIVLYAVINDAVAW